MLDKKRLGIWIGIAFISVCLLWVGYYLLNNRFTVSTGSKADIQADLKRTKETEAKMEREKAANIKRHEEYVESFGEILNGQPERLVVEAILKGDSDSAAKIAKIWQLTESKNEIAQSLVTAFTRTRGCGNERCSGHDYNEGFNNWLKDLKTKYPDNPNVTLMTMDDTDDVENYSKAFEIAIKTKGSNLDFNFVVGLCSYWVGNDVTARLRKDWNNKKSVPTALRLAQRLTCCNDDFCASSKDGEEAQRVLEAALKTASVNDLESIRDAYIWAKARQSQKAK